MNTRRNLLIVLAGLVVFVAFYAIYFPQSQMPIHIESEVIWTPSNNLHIVDEVIAIAPPFVATKTSLLRIEKDSLSMADYPPQDLLPETLSWGDPSILGIFTDGQKVALQVAGGFYELDWSTQNGPSGEWKFQETPGIQPKKTDPNWILKDGALTVKNESGKVIFKVTNPQESWVEAIENGQISFLLGGQQYKAQDPRSKTNLIFPKTHIKGQRGVFMGVYEFVPTKDGRIEKILNGMVMAMLDRSNTGLQMVPSKLATDGESVFGLLSPIVKNVTPSYWVQKYDKALKWKGDLVPARGELKPVSIAFHGQMLLALWEDGFLIGYSLDGFEMFRVQVTEGLPLDMVSDGEQIYVLTSNRLLRLTMTIKESSLPIWPRVSNLGQVGDDKNFEITVVTKDLPLVTIKGSGIQLKSIEKGENVKIMLTVSPFGLGAFMQHQAEVIIEAGSMREVVPVVFYPVGKAHRLKIVADLAIELSSGKSYKHEQSKEGLRIVGLETIGKTKTYWNRITSEAIVLDPAPGETLVKINK